MSIQAQIINLLREMQARLRLTIILVSHDLRMVRYLSTKIAVMYLGKVVEFGEAEEVCTSPRHPYTAALLSAVPAAIDDPSPANRIVLAGATVADVCDEAGAVALTALTIEEFGQIDVLINNAGISAAGRVHETTAELWDNIMRVNARGVFLVAKAVLPSMIHRGAGVIVNIASIISTTGLPNRAAYAASKGAVLALTRSMQVDYGPLGVRANALLPGTIFTPLLEPLLKVSFPSGAEALSAIRARQLTDALGRPEDVAKAALFLASDDADFALGTELVVDGGITCGRR